MPKPTPSAYGDIPRESYSYVHPTREELLKTSKRILKETFTPTIKVYGEAIVELGGKKYLVNAPKGVTIRERNDLHPRFGME